MKALFGLLSGSDGLVWNKSDLAPGVLAQHGEVGLPAISTSAARGDVAELRAYLVGWLRHQLDRQEFPAVTRMRHRQLLQDALDSLSRGLGDIRHPELAAEGVRLAVRALERITGRSDPEAVLARVFSSFCIGK